MLRGNWSKRFTPKLVGGILAFTLALCAIIGNINYGLSKEVSYIQAADQWRADYAKRARENIEQTCYVLSAGEKASCIHKAQAEYRFNEHEKRHDAEDLIAQRRSAIWTKIMGMAAVIGMALSIVGVGLVYFTFEETRRSGETAIKLLNIERAPFLSIAPIKGEEVYWEPQSGCIGKRVSHGFTSDFSLFCEIKSSGRSAVILTAICRKWVSCKHGNTPPPIPVDRNDADRVEVTIPIGSHGITMATNSEVSTKGSPEDWLTFYGYLEFTDTAEENTYVSGFAFVVDPIKRPTRGLVTAPFRGGKHWYHQQIRG